MRGADYGDVPSWDHEMTRNIFCTNANQISIETRTQKTAYSPKIRAWYAVPYVSVGLRFSVAAEYVDEFVLDDFLDVGARRAEVFARVEGCRVGRHVLADACGQAEAKVGVDVDLADRRFRRTAELVFGDADGVVQGAAVFIDDLDEFRNDGGSAVKHDREVRQTFLDFREDVEAKLRRDEHTVRIACALGRLELECAVARADGDGERVDAGAFDEFLDFVGARVGGILCADIDIVLDARQFSKLALDDDALRVRVVNDFLRQLDVVLEAVLGAVNHDRSEAVVNAGFADVEIRAVVKVKADGQIRVLQRRLDEMDEIGRLRVFARARGDLQNQRRVFFLRRLGDALDDFHVVDIEGANGVSALIGFFEHFR